MLTIVSYLLLGLFILSFVILRKSRQGYVVLGASVGLQGLVVALNPPGDLISGLILVVVGAVIFVIGILMSVQWQPEEVSELTTQDYRQFAIFFSVLALILIVRAIVFLPIVLQNVPPLVTYVGMGIALGRQAYRTHRLLYR